MLVLSHNSFSLCCERLSANASLVWNNWSEYTLIDGLGMFLTILYVLERNRLRVADLGVAGGGRPWPLAAADDRKVEK